jgi:hypothetical protein
MAPYVSCIVSRHAGGLSQIMVIWTSCGPINKFGGRRSTFLKVRVLDSSVLQV